MVFVLNNLIKTLIKANWHRAFVLLQLSAVLALTGCVSPLNLATAKNEQVILIHGFGRSDSALRKMKSALHEANYHVCTLDYDTVGVEIDALWQETDEQIDECIDRKLKTHFVGHSLGGLVIRHYLSQPDKRANITNLGEVILIGTPNKGSEIANAYQETFLMSFAGEVGEALHTGKGTLGATINPIDANIGVIAGSLDSWYSKEYFDSANDGVVSVESAKLPSMNDFIVLPVGHASMKRDDNVISQMIHFLRLGKFDHSQLTSSN